MVRYRRPKRTPLSIKNSAPGDEVVKKLRRIATGNSGYFDMDPNAASRGSVILAQVATPGDFEFTATVYYRSSDGSNQSMDIFVSNRPREREFLPIEDTDCNDNGISDCEEISSGSDTDVDFDGLPDSCEDDCDDDGITDPVQVDNGGRLQRKWHSRFLRNQRWV